MPRKTTKKNNSNKSQEQAVDDSEKEESKVAEDTQQPSTTEQTSTETQRSVPPNHIFIGKKPVMGYALSAVMQLTQYDTVVLRARGKAISTAVDVAQVATRRLGNGQFEVKNISIGTEVVGEGPEQRNVSTIEIVIGKKQS
jgi:DNA-binding protein